MRAVLASILSLALLAGCGTPLPPLALAPRVDLARFMGDWYVIASIPTFIETGAHNAIESYRLDPDGSIATTFTFREGGFDGEPRRYTPRGFVVPGTGNAVWGMRFVWPIRADYRIAYLSPDYGQVVVGREKRDYAWIMARQPRIPEADYQRVLGFLREQGYDTARVRKVPQRWP
ncbi:MAG: lipocalin family protein [Betaproteobacteria bacterium]